MGYSKYSEVDWRGLQTSAQAALEDSKNHLKKIEELEKTLNASDVFETASKKKVIDTLGKIKDSNLIGNISRLNSSLDYLERVCNSIKRLQEMEEDLKNIKADAEKAKANAVYLLGNGDTEEEKEADRQRRIQDAYDYWDQQVKDKELDIRYQEQSIDAAIPKD